MWKANMDIQFIHEKSMVLNRYITSYVTKTDKRSSELIWDDCNKNKTLHGALKSYALQHIKSRELGAFEAADKLLGHNAYGKSDVVKWLGNFFKLFKITFAYCFGVDN